MRRSLSITAVCAMVLLISVHPVTAQDASPVPGSATSLSPAVGVPFLYVGSEADEQATITIAAVQDPFDEVLEGYEPAPDSRYIMLTVIYENTGPGLSETRPDAFVVQDSGGYMWSPSSISRDENITVPDLRGVQLAPGDRLSGMVDFQLPASAELARVFYQPESSRLLLLADLNVPPEPGPGVGTEVVYEDIDATTRGLITVTEVEDPLEEIPEGYEPEAGSRYLLVTLAIENTGSIPLDVNPSNLLVRDDDGYLWTYTSVRREENVVVPDLQSRALAPGSRISGVVGFQLPADAQLADVLYQPVSGRLIVLAQLQPVETSNTLGPAGAATAADCNGFETWYVETSQRLTQATDLSQQAARLEDETVLEAAALEFTELATSQEAMDVPPAAMVINDMLVDVLTDYHDALAEITTAGDDGGDVVLALVGGMNAFNDASRDFAALGHQVTELATSCGVPT